MKDDGEAKKFFESEKVELFRKPSTSKNYSEIIK
jgi:hypothetical protein